MMLITASILSADFGHLEREVQSVENDADWLQLDVMDGHFVPNLSFGAPVMRWIKTKLPIDVHLMVANPAERLKDFLPLKPANITFHAEAVKNTAERTSLIDAIHKVGAKAGIAINPETPVSAISDVVSSVDLVLVMSVHPGFSGQTFIADVLSKVRALRKAHPTLMIQMDGGIDPSVAGACIEAGADNLVAASAIFGAANRAEAIRKLRVQTP
jgi:ribulose-phosphate 3-epimerase